MLSEGQRKVFFDFNQSAQQEEIIDPKTIFLIRIAAAMAFGCYP